MQGDWLQKGNHSRCVLFMAGWGMGPEPFLSLAVDGCDLFMCYDYRELSPPDMEVFSGYERLELVAWSMGVWVAAKLFSGREDFFSRTTALGGTLEPIDDQKGIPPVAFDATITNLNEKTLLAFYASMFDEPAQAEEFIGSRPQRSVASVQEELVSLRDIVLQTGMVQSRFNHKIVTKRDRIFPARNQLRAWGKRQCKMMKWPHFPFYIEDCRSILFSAYSTQR